MAPHRGEIDGKKISSGPTSICSRAPLGSLLALVSCRSPAMARATARSNDAIIAHS
jgi:hypothetical protein